MPSKDIIAAAAATTTITTATTSSIASCSTTSPAMRTRDVDDLVNEIKLNLRLRGTSCTSGCSEGETNVSLMSTNNAMRPGNNNNINNNNNGACGGAGGGSVLVTCSGRTKIRALNHRIAPYFVPPRSGTDSGCHSCGSPRCARTCLRQPGTESSDPYQLLQQLLKTGGLINEAVRRISKTEKPVIKCYDYEKDEYDVAATTTSTNLIGLEV